MRGTDTTVEMDHDLLPASVQTLADTIGLDGALRLVQTYGGSDFYVPRYVTPALENLLGRAAAEALVENYYSGSDRLKLPRCAAAVRAVTHRRIVSAYLDGATAADLALSHGCTERWIFHIVAQHRQAQASRQGELF